jgi:hypothetical protein
MALGKFSITKKDGSSDLPVTAAGTFICDVVTSLASLLAFSLFLRLAYGSGGTSVKAYLQTTLDDGASWIDIACLTFATAAAAKCLNFSALTPKTTAVTPTDGTLTDDTAVDGLVGDRLRLKVVVTGTYAGNTVLSGRIVAR